MATVSPGSARPRSAPRVSSDMPDSATISAAAAQLVCLCWRSAAGCLKTSLAGAGKDFCLLLFLLLNFKRINYTLCHLIVKHNQNVFVSFNSVSFILKLIRVSE